MTGFENCDGRAQCNISVNLGPLTSRKGEWVSGRLCSKPSSAVDFLGDLKQYNNRGSDTLSMLQNHAASLLSLHVR